MGTPDQNRYQGGGLRGAGPKRASFVRRAMRLCLPEETTVQLPGLGELGICPAVIEVEAGWISTAGGSCEAVRLERDDGQLLLLVERGFALRTVNAILGCEAVVATGPLSRIERGIFDGVVAAVLSGMACPPDVRLHGGAGQFSPTEAIVVELSLGLRGAAGRAWLCAEAEFLARTLASSARMLATVSLELGRTAVPVSELAEAGEGDAVVFDGTAALSSAEPWPIQIRRGDVVLPALLRPDGAIGLSSIRADERDYGTLTRVERGPSRTAASCNQAAASDADRVEIVAELGRVEVAELARLLFGAPLDGSRSDRILLRLDDTAWAEGEIAAIDGELAVRIRRKLAA